jgi:hypothetical protein
MDRFLIPFLFLLHALHRFLFIQPGHEGLDKGIAQLRANGRQSADFFFSVRA